jgi:predicted metal-dependent phosphoesterase TrpH
MMVVAMVVAIRLVIGAGAMDGPILFTGDLTFDQYEHILEHPFTVPNGVARIDVRLEHTGKERRTVVDLGLRSPTGVRGWSGGRESAVHVSTLSATPGYLPGRIEPGRWSVILGVPNIRRDSRDTYAVTITFDRVPLRAAPAMRNEAAWYAGDLHLHSGHSDGRATTKSGESMPAPVHKVLDPAAASGLDFVALTDHNTGAHWLDVDRLQPYYDTLLLLHGREITTYRGHANAVGERAMTDFTLASPALALRPLLRRITRGGAFLSINHPRRPDDESCLGCGWNDASPEILRSVHGVEAVNGEDWKTPVYGWPFWADALNRGARLALVGGSDDHTPENTSDNHAGSPTTVVFASSLSEPAIVEGLRSGRTYVRVRGPQGPSIEFTALVESGSYEVGDTIYEPLSIIALEAIVTGARGQALQWIRRGIPVKTVQIDEDGVMRANLKAHPGDWFSVVVSDEHGPTLLTSAIYTE